MFHIKKITKEQQQTSTWAGGTTTQFAIYPEESNYADRDFLWRLSSAVVELEESNFTRLPGFDRHLMVLDGALKVVHQEQHTAMLQQYEQDFFKGSWDTISYGRATDFNLMLKEGVTGRLEHYSIAVGHQVSLKLEKGLEKQGFFACFCYIGHISLEVSNHVDCIEEGELVEVNYDEDLTATIVNSANQECSLIIAFIEV